MIRVAFVDSSGIIQYYCDTTDPDLYEHGQVQHGLTGLYVPEQLITEDIVQDIYWDHSDETWRQLPPKPTEYVRWTGTEWEPDGDAITQKIKSDLRIAVREHQQDSVWYQGYLFQASPLSVTNLTARLAVPGPVPAGFTWRTTDNEELPVTREFLEGLLKVIQDREYALLKSKWAVELYVSTLPILERAEQDIRALLDNELRVNQL